VSGSQARRSGDHAVRAVRDATFIGLTLVTFFLYASLGGLLVLLPY
jgi:hypothetical protein